MATFSISAVARKAQATANGSTTQFAFSFSVNTEADVAVFVGTTLKTISTHYTVSITSSTGAGSITFTSGNTPTNGQIVTIMSKTALARSSVYTSGGTINATSLETDFDTNMMLFQQQDERLDRVITAPVDDATSIDMTLPNKDARKGTVLGFNATSGNPEAGPSITAVQSLADVTTAINLLGTSAVVEDLGILGTAAIVEDVGLLGTSANVAAMAQLSTSAVLADMALLGTSAVVEDMGLLATSAVIEDMGLLATSAVIEDMGLLATSAVIEDIGLLATSAVVEDMGLLANSTTIGNMNLLGTSDAVSDMNTLATSSNVTNQNTLAGISGNITTVAGIASNVTAVAGDASDIGAVAGKATEIGLLGNSDTVADLALLGTSSVVEDMGLLANSTTIGNMAQLGTAAVVEDMGILGTSANVTAMSNVSGSISDVNTVATNLSGITAFSAVYSSGGTDPSSNLNEGDLFFNTSSDALKVYDGSAWVAGVTAGSGFLPLAGGQLTGNLTMAGSQTVDGRDVSADGTKLDTLATVGTTSITTLGTIGTGVWQGTAIASAYIAGDAITGAKIADNAINSEHYTDGSIDTAHIADSQITVAKMAANSVDSAQYVDGSIDRAHLAADIIDGTKIANDVINSEHYAAGSIDNEHIADNAINSEHYADGSIDRAHLAADIIDGSKIANDVINSEHYVAGSIDAEHLASDSVTEAKIAANSIDSQAYVDGSIDQVHLANAIVNEAKMQISNSPVNGYMLTAQSGNTGGLTWAEAGGGGLVFIATSGAISSGTATVVFANQFDASKYHHYKFMLKNIKPNSNYVVLSMQTSSDGGSNYLTSVDDYQGNGATQYAGMKISAQYIGQNHGASGEYNLYQPLDSGNRTTATGTGVLGYTSDNWYNLIAANQNSYAREASTADNAVRFIFNSGEFASGEIQLYGIAKS